MKFKYVGEQVMGCLDFMLAGIIPDGGVIEPNKVYEVPDDDAKLISMCRATPLFEEQTRTVKKTKGDK